MKPIFDKPRRTENILYAKMRTTMQRVGVLIRMENLIIPGLPDCLFIYNEKIILIELKVLRSGKITMPQFQYSMAMEMVKHINPNHHWYWVSEDSGLGQELIAAYRFKDLSNIEPERGNIAKIVRMDIRNAIPRLIFAKNEDILDWFILLDKGTTTNGH